MLDLAVASLDNLFFLVVDKDDQVSVLHSVGLCEQLDFGRRVVGLLNDQTARVPPTLVRTPGQLSSQGACFGPATAHPPTTTSIVQARASTPNLQLCAPDPSLPEVTTFHAFRMPQKWIWPFLARAPMSPPDALDLGLALQRCIPSSLQSRAEALVDWLCLACTATSATNVAAASSVLQKKWTEVPGSTPDIRTWCDRWLQIKWPIHPTPPTVATAASTGTPAPPGSLTTLTAADLATIMADFGTRLGTQQHALQQQEKQKLPPHLLTALCSACGWSGDSPDEAGLSDFWKAFTPLRSKNLHELRSFVQNFFSSCRVPTFEVEVAISTSILQALKNCTFDGSLDFADRCMGLSPFSIVSPRLITNWADTQRSMVALESTLQPTSRDHQSMAALNPAAQVPLNDRDLLLMLETLLTFFQKVFGPLCPLLTPLAALRQALRDHHSHLQLSPHKAVCLVWRIHLGCRMFFKRQDLHCAVLQQLANTVASLGDIPSDQVPVALVGPFQLHQVTPQLALPPAPSFGPPPPAAAPTPAPAGPKIPATNHSAHGQQFAQIFAQAKAKDSLARLTSLFTVVPAPPFPDFQAVLGPEFCALFNPKAPCGRFHLLGSCPEGASCTRGHHLPVPPPDPVLRPALDRFQKVVTHFTTHCRPNKKQKK